MARKKMKLNRLILVGACIAGLSISAKGQEIGPLSIVPGKSVAGVELGSTDTAFRKVFPTQSKYDDYRNSLPDGCPQETLSWFDYKKDDGGVVAYLQAGKIFQMSVHSSRLALPLGLRMNSPELIKSQRAYPQGRKFVLVGSGGKANGGRDLVYWVDMHAGIAFEFCCQAKLLSGVYIFVKGSTFLPGGCVTVPQEWKLLRTNPH